MTPTLLYQAMLQAVRRTAGADAVTVIVKPGEKFGAGSAETRLYLKPTYDGDRQPLFVQQLQVPQDDENYNVFFGQWSKRANHGVEGVVDVTVPLHGDISSEVVALVEALARWVVTSDSGLLGVFLRQYHRPGDDERPGPLRIPTDVLLAIKAAQLSDDIVNGDDVNDRKKKTTDEALVQMARQIHSTVREEYGATDEKSVVATLRHFLSDLTAVKGAAVKK
jgi:hypothetical protein